MEIDPSFPLSALGWSRNYLIEVHGLREAEKEVNCWLRGVVYRWTPLDEAIRQKGNGVETA